MMRQGWRRRWTGGLLAGIAALLAPVAGHAAGRVIRTGGDPITPQNAPRSAAIRMPTSACRMSAGPLRAAMSAFARG